MSATPRLGAVMIDTAQLDVVVGFWTALLDVGEALRVPGYVWLERPGAGVPSLAFQEVPEAKSGKNRVHLDFRVEDLEAFAETVGSLGGARLADHSIPGAKWAVFADPEGNEFCAAVH